MRTRLLSAAAVVALAAPAAAEIRTREVEYRQGDTPLQGFVAWDDAPTGKRPGVLVVHEFWGHDEHARNQAIRLARAGYVGFALDLYGKGKVATHPEDARAFAAAARKDPATTAARFDAAVKALAAQPEVDPAKVAVFGYCFGGGVALDMARAGRDLAAVVTFHGSLAPSGEPARPGRVKPAILVLTGGADPNVPPDRVKALEEEMKAAGANVKVVVYPGAKHSFTNPDADRAGRDSAAYDPKADAESWDAAVKFLRQVLGR